MDYFIDYSNLSYSVSGELIFLYCSIVPLVIYSNSNLNKFDIIKENKGKSGIYLWTNKLTKDIYVGQSKDLSKRFIKYFSFSYLKSRDVLIISSALIKYGYSNFNLTILEYCDISELNQREQYYFDKL